MLLRAYNYWDFPKGVVSKGEDPMAAAIRELGEETTLTSPIFRWEKVFLETPPYSYGKVARYYIAEVSHQNVSLPVNPEIGRPEHVEFKWASYEEANKLLGPRVRKILEWANNLIYCAN